MTHRGLDQLATAVLGAGTALVALSSGTAPALADDTDATLIMGGTTETTPDSTFLANVNNDYILPNISPATDTPTALATPEQLFPLPGYSQLTLGQSEVQGLADLQAALATESVTTDPVVFGYSQSATIATDELDGIANGTVTPPPDLSFVLVGDPNNPDGGLLERFDGLYLPGVNLPFNGATPDLDIPSAVYTHQYDGAADFPEYPLNPVADLNAMLGVFFDHDYADLTPEQVATAIVEPVSPDAVGDTSYYFIPTQTLPLLEPLILTGAPQWLVDLLTPDLRVLVDLGYGNIGGSVAPDYANLPTPADLFEQINPTIVDQDLIAGAGQGITAALVDTGNLPVSDMPDAYPFVPSLDPDLSVNLGQSGQTLLSELTGLIGSELYALNIPDVVSGTSDAGDFITSALTNLVG
jgi:hypothetical protein